MTPAQAIAERLDGRSNGSGWLAKCPAHDDGHASLSLSDGNDGRALLMCHAGCSASAILRALGLEWRDLFPHAEPAAKANHGSQSTSDDARRIYRILDADGNLVAEHVREEGKRFWWRRPGCERGLGGLRVAELPLYGSEWLRDHPGDAVLVVEGEKAADAARGLGLLACGTACGAATVPSCRPLSVLYGRDVILWPDNDEPGRRHMQRIGSALGGKAKSVRSITWGVEAGDDAADFVARGGTRDGVLALIAAAAGSAPGALDKEVSTEPAVLVKVSTVKPERVYWFWTHRIVLGKITILDGDPGLGKSALTLDLAARKTTGRPMPGDEIASEPAGAVFLTGEDGIADTIRPRLEAAGADLERVHVLTAVRDGEDRPRLPVLPDDVRAIREAMRRVGARLLVIDPLMAFLAGRVDSHRDQDVRGALHQLADLAEDTGAAVVIVRHLNKAGGGHPLYRGGGSIGIIGAARSGLLVAPDPTDQTRRVLAVTKSNLGPVPPSLAYRLVPAGDSIRVEWDGVAECSARDLLACQDGAEGAGPREEAEGWLRELLADGPVAARDVQRQAKDAGVAYITLRRAKDRLGVRATKAGGRFGGNPAWLWELPDPLKMLTPPEDAHPQKVSTFRPSEHLQGGLAPSGVEVLAFPGAEIQDDDEVDL